MAESNGSVVGQQAGQPVQLVQQVPRATQQFIIVQKDGVQQRMILQTSMPNQQPQQQQQIIYQGQRIITSQVGGGAQRVIVQPQQTTQQQVATGVQPVRRISVPASTVVNSQGQRVIMTQAGGQTVMMTQAGGQRVMMTQAGGPRVMMAQAGGPRVMMTQGSGGQRIIAPSQISGGQRIVFQQAPAATTGQQRAGPQTIMTTTVQQAGVQQQRPILIRAPQAGQANQQRTITLPPGFTLPPGCKIINTAQGQKIIIPSTSASQVQGVATTSNNKFVSHTSASPVQGVTTTSNNGQFVPHTSASQVQGVATTSNESHVAQGTPPPPPPQDTVSPQSNEVKEDVDCPSSAQNTQQIGDGDGSAAKTEEEEGDDIDITISNVVASFNVRCHINLRTVSTLGANVIYKRENGIVYMKMRNPQVTASIWSSGKITITGATSEDNAKRASRQVARVLQKMGFKTKFTNFRVVNVLGSCAMPWDIRIAQFSSEHKQNASYEPELHPGVTYRIKDPKAVLKIFSTGSITCTAPRVDNVSKAIEHIHPLVYPYRNKRTEKRKPTYVYTVPTKIPRRSAGPSYTANKFNPVVSDEEDEEDMMEDMDSSEMEDMLSSDEDY